MSPMAASEVWLPTECHPGGYRDQPAGHGALAGAIAGAIGGAIGLVLALGIATVFVPLGILGEAAEGAGLDPTALWEMLATVTASVICGITCYALGVGIAAGLGALGVSSSP